MNIGRFDLHFEIYLTRKWYYFRINQIFISCFNFRNYQSMINHMYNEELFVSHPSLKSKDMNEINEAGS